MLQRKMFQVCVCRRWSHVLPSARFQLEHFVRLSDLRLTGPEVHWTMCVCVHAAQSVIVWSCMCAIVCINMGECTHV